MLTLDEWLTTAGFLQGNPFAIKEADLADTVIPSLFVQHPAYNEILDGPESIPCASSVLHAPRGAGKSTSRQMFEGFCAVYRPRSLIVHLNDWMPIAKQRHDPHFTFAAPHIEQVIHQTVKALACCFDELELHAPAEPALRAVLSWMCAFSASALEFTNDESLHARIWLEPAVPQDDIRRLTARAQLSQVAAVVRAMGCQDLYVLADNLDELELTARDANIGAALVAPLLGNLRLNEVRNLAFKYFIPSEIFEVLQRNYSLRTDRITCAELRWDQMEGTKMLGDLLRLRLEYYSGGFHKSLAALAVTELRDIDDRLIHTALGNPRLLLNLCDWTIRACAAHASQDDWLIREEDVAKAETQADRSLESLRLFEVSAVVTHTSLGVPLFRIRNGVLWLGDEMLEGWHNFTPLRRELIEFLYAHRGEVCYKEHILRDVWAKKGFTPGDDTLRKLADRVIELIEPDPKQPVYIEKVRGGHYRLNNATE